MISAIKDIEKRLNDGIERTPEEREKCWLWLLEYMTVNDLTLFELEELCWKDSTWIFDQIFA